MTAPNPFIKCQTQKGQVGAQVRSSTTFRIRGFNFSLKALPQAQLKAVSTALCASAQPEEQHQSQTATQTHQLQLTLVEPSQTPRFKFLLYETLI